MATTYKFDTTRNSYFQGRDLRVTDDTGHTIKINGKDNMPAVNVKDNALYGDMPADALAAADKLKAVEDGVVQAIYDGVAEDFWGWAEELAAEHKIGPLYQAGRSGGWAAFGGVQGLDGPAIVEPDEDDLDARNEFLNMAFQIHKAIEEEFRPRFHDALKDAAREEDEKIDCPNCTFRGSAEDIVSGKHTDSGCVIGALIGVVSDRGECEIDAAKIPDIDVDAIWNALGPVSDDVEETISAAPSDAPKEA